MNIEELAFEDRKNLAQLNEIDLLDIIEFLQNDRKQWINQFAQTHNESIDIQKENKQLKDNWNYIKKMLKEARQEEYISGYCGTCTDIDIDFLLGKMQELEGNDSNE